MPKTGYVLSEKEVAQVHKLISDSIAKLIKSVEDLHKLQSRFPVPPASNSITTESQT